MATARRVVVSAVVVLVVATCSYWLGARGKYSQAIPQVRRGFFAGFNLHKTALVIQYRSGSTTSFAWTNGEHWVDAKGVEHTGGTPPCLATSGTPAHSKVTIGVVTVAPVGNIFGTVDIAWLRCGWLGQ